MNKEKTKTSLSTPTAASGQVELRVSQPPENFRHLDLFSGIGGFALAAKSIWSERYENVGFCEIDKFCQKVLKKNFGEDIIIYDDISNLRKEDINGTVDLISGGFPCQPYSKAGKQTGEDDERSLWPEMFRIIKQVKPRYIIAENVDNVIKHKVVREICDNLGSQNYTTEIYNIPALVVGLPHIRKRVWFVSYYNGDAGCHHAREIQNSPNARKEKKWEKDGEWMRIITRTIFKKQFWLASIARLCGKANGLPRGMDKDRLNRLGNSIVPQIAMVLLAALKTVDDGRLKQQERFG